ncbi:unnamed protein product, partial [Discosporangium mesarthrocarpum]
ANAPDKSEFGQGYPPIHYAAYRGHVDACRELHAHGAKLLAAGRNGVTPLFLAVQQGQEEVVRFLLD